MSQKLMDLARQFLEPDEEILAAVAGQYEKPKPGGQKEHIRSCLLLATDRRRSCSPGTGGLDVGSDGKRHPPGRFRSQADGLNNLCAWTTAGPGVTLVSNEE